MTIFVYIKARVTLGNFGYDPIFDAFELGYLKSNSQVLT